VTRTVDHARELAIAAHQGQVDKAGKPYIEHPRTVAELLAPHGELAVMAGWLHDVVEDTPISLEQLRELGFPPEVVAAVDSVTWRDGESYEDLIRRAAADPVGRLVKLADNATNSDEARLALLDVKTADRLRRKYARAREILEAAQ
jgi:(p)ppGpp synthase/HD superfamily hydrolase